MGFGFKSGGFLGFIGFLGLVVRFIEFRFGFGKVFILILIFISVFYFRVIDLGDLEGFFVLFGFSCLYMRAYIYSLFG